MEQTTELAKAVRAALDNDPTLDLQEAELTVHATGTAVRLEGEVPHIIAKRRAPLVAAAVAGVSAVTDNLTLRPGEPMSDDRIRDQVRLALLEEPVYAFYTLRMIDHTGAVELLRGDLPAADGHILFNAEDGVVTLEGQVGSLSHKRLAALLAWWIPGARNVVNGLTVAPPEEDNDGELADAVDLALEKDSLLPGDLIRVQAKDGVVTLGGSTRTEHERTIAEHDAWYVEGVRDVVNRLTAP